MENKDIEKELGIAFDAHSEAIFRYCSIRTRDPELAKDMVQDVYVKAWKYMNEGHTIDNFLPFLYRLARNTVIDWYRKRKTFSLETLMEKGFEPSDPFGKTDEKSEIRIALEAVKKLSPEDQDLITWRFVEEIPVSEIAEMLETRQNTVAVRINRALARLQKIMHS